LGVFIGTNGSNMKEPVVNITKDILALIARIDEFKGA
jgi:hypothetical protein